MAELAGQRPSATGLITRRGSLSYATLLRLSTAVADHLRSQGVHPGHRVLIGCGQGPEFVLAYLGAALADAVPVVAAPALVPDLDHLVAAGGGVIGLPSQAGAMAPHCPFGFHSIEFTDGEVMLAHCGGAPTERPLAPRSGHILYTSGSTGAAKAIAWSAERLAAAPKGGWLLKAGPAAALSPLFHAAGLQLMVTALIHGTPLALIEDPHSIAGVCMQLAQHGVTCFKCMPPHVELILASGLSLPECVQRIQVSGAPIAADRLRAFASAVAPAEVRKVYGLAEVGALARLDPDDLIRKAHTVGRPIGAAKIEIRGSDGQAVSPGETGEVVAVFDSLPAGDGYVAPTRELAARFTNGVMHTRDRGFFDEDGYLVLTERTSELLKVAGKLVSVVHLEQALRDAIGDARLVVGRRPDKVRGEVPVVVFEPSPQTPATERDWLALSQRLFEPYQVPRAFVPVGQVPVNPSGKIARETINDKLARLFSPFSERSTLGARLCACHRLPTGEAILWLGVGAAPSPLSVGLHFALLDAAATPVADAVIGHSKKFGTVIALSPVAEVTSLDVFASPLASLASRLPGHANTVSIIAPLGFIPGSPRVHSTRLALWGGNDEDHPAGSYPNQLGDDDWLALINDLETAP